MTEHGSNGSEGNSSDRGFLIERVISIHDDGVELEYDLPPDASDNDRAATWQLPARVFRPAHGTLRLTNRADLLTRVDPWLKKAGWTRAACGRLIFTWNAFRIDCEPESILPALQRADIEAGDLREGAPYKTPEALAPVSLRREQGGLYAQMTIDPETVRRVRAKTDVDVAEISGQVETFDAALREHAGDQIEGTIMVRFNLDTQGNVTRRVTITKVHVKDASGLLTDRTVTETIDRRLMAPNEIRPH